MPVGAVSQRHSHWLVLWTVDIAGVQDVAATHGHMDVHGEFVRRPIMFASTRPLGVFHSLEISVRLPGYPGRSEISSRPLIPSKTTMR